MTHPNEDLVRGLFQAFGSRDVDALENQYLHENIRWHVPGRHPLSGEYVGHGQVRDFLSQNFELSARTVRVELDDVLANDRHAVALFTGRAEREDRRLETYAAVIFAIQDGKVTEAWHRPSDPYAADQFWA